MNLIEALLRFCLMTSEIVLCECNECKIEFQDNANEGQGGAQNSFFKLHR